VSTTLNRRRNLEYLVKLEKNAATFARKVEMSKSQLSQILNTPERKISSVVARNIENKLNLSTGWLDAEHEEAMTPEDIAEASMRDSGFTVIKYPSALALNWQRWSKPDFIVAHPNFENMSVFVDIHSKYLGLGVPFCPDNTKDFVYIPNDHAPSAGTLLLAHFKHWIEVNEEGLESNNSLVADEKDETTLFIQKAVNHLNKEQRYAWFIMAETTMKANNIDISIWGQFGDNEKEKQGKTTEVNNNE
jgi:hypothetical protein